MLLESGQVLSIYKLFMAPKRLEKYLLTLKRAYVREYLKSDPHITSQKLKRGQIAFNW